MRDVNKRNSTADLFVIRKVKAQSQAHTDETGSGDVSKSASHLSC
jgi:hypothetical protein